MNRAEFVLALSSLSAAARGRERATGVFAEIDIKRDATTLLAPFTIDIALRNTTKAIVGIDFPTTDLYRIDVLHDDVVLWSSAHGHQPLTIARRIDVPPGMLRLVSYIVDGTTDDRRAYPPGRVLVRVTMLGKTLASSLAQTIDIAPPLAIAAARKAKLGDVVTIAGTTSTEGGLAYLTDATDSIRLSHSLGLHPSGTFAVRGSLESLGVENQFAIGRFARTYEMLPSPSPTPS